MLKRTSRYLQQATASLILQARRSRSGGEPIRHRSRIQPPTRHASSHRSTFRSIEPASDFLRLSSVVPYLNVLTDRILDFQRRSALAAEVPKDCLSPIR